MSKKTDNTSFEEQIGHLGGITEQPDTTPSVGEKLRYMNNNSLDNITNEEKSSMEAFLNKTRAIGAEFHEHGVNISEGWIPVDRSEMGVRTKFYPDDWVFYIRPATVEAIKNWSSIDEERIDIVNSVFNDIMRSCVSIKSAAGNVPWSKINSWDRFWFVLKIREYTFKQGEAKIEFTDTCSECDEELTFTLTSQSLFYEFPDDSIVEKHWNSIDRAWFIDPHDYGVDRAPVKLYVPTLEKDQAILDWAIAKQRANKKIDSVFLKFLPWLLPKAPKDEAVLEKFINDCHSTFKSWDIEMFDFMDDVLRNVTINPSEKLKMVCPHCGEEAVSNVRFPNGVRALFKTEPKHKKFGTR